MGLKDTLNDGLDAVKKGIDNVKDTVSETVHRSNAEAEQATRDAAGDALTPGEKVGSMLRQGKETLQGDVDAAKRDLRNNT
jgi:hypothetical protein